MAETKPENPPKSFPSSPFDPTKKVAFSTTDPADGVVLPRTKKKKMNKYVLACSLVASMNSILSGYGEFFTSFISQFYQQEQEQEQEIGLLFFYYFGLLFFGKYLVTILTLPKSITNRTTGIFFSMLLLKRGDAASELLVDWLLFGAWICFFLFFPV